MGKGAKKDGRQNGVRGREASAYSRSNGADGKRIRRMVNRIRQTPRGFKA